MKAVTVLAALAFVVASPLAQAQDAPSPAQPAAPTPTQLNGGASAISETHGGWVVNCLVRNNARICTASHQSFGSGNQRVFAMELAPRDKGTAGGNLALPFGMAVTRGVTLTLDDKPLPGASYPFSTCLIGGCLVPIAFDEATLAKVKAGKLLKIQGWTADTGQTITFSVPLAGFASAIARSSELLAK